jgi:hypothetical protein
VMCGYDIELESCFPACHDPAPWWSQREGLLIAPYCWNYKPNDSRLYSCQLASDSGALPSGDVELEKGGICAPAEGCGPAICPTSPLGIFPHTCSSCRPSSSDFKRRPEAGYFERPGSNFLIETPSPSEGQSRGGLTRHSAIVGPYLNCRNTRGRETI